MRGAIPQVAFDLALEHGRCVGVRIPGEPHAVEALALASLVPEERAFAATLGIVRRRSWVGGRAAMRVALERAGYLAEPAILSDDRGAPLLPAGLSGSISHKEALAVALVTRDRGRVGVDLELDRPRPIDVASKVLTDEEQAAVALLEPNERSREVLLRFSLKEAIYKAIDPFARRYVGFKEVTVAPAADGSVSVEARWPEPDLQVEAMWLRLPDEGLVVTTARCRPKPPAGPLSAP